MVSLKMKERLGGNREAFEDLGSALGRDEELNCSPEPECKQFLWPTETPEDDLEDDWEARKEEFSDFLE